jgi:Uma2 family endonuclease
MNPIATQPPESSTQPRRAQRGSRAPDIAIEVISPNERASESHDKVRAYLRNGTTEVWQVYPKSRTVLIHRGEIARSLDWSQPVQTDLLPGFALELVKLFG